MRATNSLRDRKSEERLRRGFISTLAEKGVNAYTIKRLARHKSLETTKTYVHLSNRNLRNQLDDAFGGK